MYNVCQKVYQEMILSRSKHLFLNNFLNNNVRYLSKSFPKNKISCVVQTKLTNVGSSDTYYNNSYNNTNSVFMSIPLQNSFQTTNVMSMDDCKRVTYNKSGNYASIITNGNGDINLVTLTKVSKSQKGSISIFRPTHVKFETYQIKTNETKTLSYYSYPYDKEDTPLIFLCVPSNHPCDDNNINIRYEYNIHDVKEGQAVKHSMILKFNKAGFLYYVVKVHDNYSKNHRYDIEIQKYYVFD